MADNSDLQKIQASEKPTSDDFEYAYVETVNKAFVRIAKERLKEILGANRYTNEEIDQKLSTIPKFNIEVVSSLPTTDISETTIYLVSSGDDSENLYTEYININGLWEILGTQKSTFSGSAKDVTYDDTETKLGATNVQDAFGKLSQTNVDRANSLWNIIKKTAFVEALTEEELTAFKTSWGITEEEPDTPVEPEVTTEPIYQLAEETTFDGATCIDTGYKLLDVDKSWSVCVDFTGNGNTVWDASPNASKGMCLSNRGGYFRTLYAALTQVDISGGKETNHKVIVTHTKGTNSVQYHYIYEDADRVDNEVVKDSYLTDGNIISTGALTVKLGANYSGTSEYYKGTIHRFEIYERVLSGDEINAFMEGV